ncbi:MAG: hypothetical protein KBC84_08155, partial [Proteobacteria bacterium]|nr:hypothetical protein [Pseudomonadota bacterium]
LTPLNARDGIYGVFGNHDYLEGIEVISKTLQNNINWITNTSTTITKNDDSLLLLGVDDYNRGNPDLKKTFSNYSDKHFFKILLSHNPDITISKDKDLLNHSNLILAGHTHGGQIKLPKIKPVICRTRQKKHVQSLSHFNSTAVYVSNGVGYGGVPLRVFCPPEIVVINLKPELRKNTESFQEVTQNI